MGVWEPQLLGKEMSIGLYKIIRRGHGIKRGDDGDDDDGSFC